MAFNNTHFLLKSFNAIILNNNISDNDTSPYISQDNENEGYLYLLLFDLLIFCLLTYITYTSSKK